MHLSLHSATKGIAGHNDATLGVVSGERDLIDAVWAYSVLHGATPSPFDALNALRGIRTLAVRTNHQAASAQFLAESLQRHPAVTAVHYPGSAHAPAARPGQAADAPLRHGVRGRARRRHAPRSSSCCRRCSCCAWPRRSAGPETLVCHPATTTHASLTPEEAAAQGVTPGLLRVSVGLEDPADLLADLRSALAAAAEPAMAVIAADPRPGRHRRHRCSRWPTG